MKTLPFILAVLLVRGVQATTIPVDLGPSTGWVVLNSAKQYEVHFDSSIDTLSGQGTSIDLMFTDGHFIHIFEQSTRNISFSPVLLLSGIGTLSQTVFSVYTLDADGNQNGPAWTTAGYSVTSDGTEPFRFGLGYNYPLYTPNEEGYRGSGEPAEGAFDFYGIRLEGTLTMAPEFEVLDSYLRFSVYGNKWNSRIAIGPHVPETGATLALFGIAMLCLVGLKLAT